MLLVWGVASFSAVEPAAGTDGEGSGAPDALHADVIIVPLPSAGGGEAARWSGTRFLGTIRHAPMAAPDRTRMQAARRLALLALALLAACATPAGPTFIETGATLPPLKPGEGRIVFYTPSKRFGQDVQPEIKLNGTLVGFAITSGYFYVDRPPGRYEATGRSAADGRIELPLTAGETRYVRAFPPSAFSVNAVHFLLVPATEGLADMTGLVYSGR